MARQSQSAARHEPEVLNTVESLLRQHEGRSEAITSGEINEYMDMHEGHDTNPVIRDVVRELTFTGRLPVASSNSGYFVPANEAEVDRYVKDMRSRADAIQARAEQMERAAENEGIKRKKFLRRLLSIFG